MCQVNNEVTDGLEEVVLMASPMLVTLAMGGKRLVDSPGWSSTARLKEEIEIR